MPQWTHHRARVAALSRDRAPDDPELLAARRDLAAAREAARGEIAARREPAERSALDRLAKTRREPWGRVGDAEESRASRFIAVALPYLALRTCG
jgi:hypothetical protein